MKYWEPDEDAIDERATFNAIHNLTTTDIWDAINQSGLDSFNVLLSTFKEAKKKSDGKNYDVETLCLIGLEIIDMIDDFIEEELIDIDTAREQLIEEHRERE